MRLRTDHVRTRADENLLRKWVLLTKLESIGCGEADAAEIGDILTSVCRRLTEIGQHTLKLLLWRCVCV